MTTPGDKRKKIVVCGPADLEDAKLVKRKLEFLTLRLKHPPIICTRAITRKVEHNGEHYWVGTDQLVEKWAHGHKYLVMRFHPWYDRHPTEAAARKVRDKEMIAAGDFFVAFWDGKCNDTANMIKMAQLFDLEYRIIDISEV